MNGRPIVAYKVRVFEAGFDENVARFGQYTLHAGRIVRVLLEKVMVVFRQVVVDRRVDEIFSFKIKKKNLNVKKIELDLKKFKIF